MDHFFKKRRKKREDTKPQKLHNNVECFLIILLRLRRETPSVFDSRFAVFGDGSVVVVVVQVESALVVAVVVVVVVVCIFAKRMINRVRALFDQSVLSFTPLQPNNPFLK